MVRNTRYVLVLLINEDRPGVLKYTHLYNVLREHEKWARHLFDSDEQYWAVADGQALLRKCYSES